MILQTIPQNYIFNATRKDPSDGDQIEKYENDFYLRAMKIVNDTNHPMQINAYTFLLISKGAIVYSRSYNATEVNKRSQLVHMFAQRYLKKRDSPLDAFRQFTLISRIGNDTFWEGPPIVESSLLQPNEASGLLGESFQFIGVTNEIIDTLRIQIDYDSNGQSHSKSFDRDIKQHHSNGEYIFPLAGPWQVYSNYNDLSNHRDSYSQEFALDLIKLDFAELNLTKGQQSNESASSYNEPIFAVADGEVVEIVNIIPENPSFFQMLPQEQMIDLGLTHGVGAVTAGNYIILDHKNGEYSLYGHLIPGSIMIKNGDIVKQGDVVGNLGNSGNSDGPHLHFQLMDAPNLASGRGFPCHFTNIIDGFGRKITQLTEPKIVVYGKLLDN